MCVSTQTYMPFFFSFFLFLFFAFVSLTSVMWASASSSMFSINITKTKQQHRKQSRAKNIHERGGRREEKITQLLEKVQKSGNGLDERRFRRCCAEIGFDRYEGLLMLAFY